MNKQLHRGTGLLWIEAINSNPNGNPDQDSEPRTRTDGLGMISPVSLKHKVRELVGDKEGSIWQEISGDLGISAEESWRYDILEQKETKRIEVRKLSNQEFLDKYWDARVFGSTFLEKNEKDSTYIHTGVVQFGLGISLSPIEVDRLTTTKILPAEDGKGKGMGPLSYRVVRYGLYTMPFFVNAVMARRTQCTALDIELLLRVLPHAYEATASYMRPQVNIRHAYYVEHGKARGCFNDLEIIETLTPTPLALDIPAKSIKDYDVESVYEKITALNEKMQGKAGPVTDLMEMM
ncbi:MAG: type I CRISPR-associated protein Cas7 [Eubacteriales bacterium]|nr:type I CRISPR-associated protein Cas7 [Eubacteriales bacterium]